MTADDPARQPGHLYFHRRSDPVSTGERRWRIQYRKSTNGVLTVLEACERKKPRAVRANRVGENRIGGPPWARATIGFLKYLPRTASFVVTSLATGHSSTHGSLGWSILEGSGATVWVCVDHSPPWMGLGKSPWRQYCFPSRMCTRWKTINESVSIGVTDHRSSNRSSVSPTSSRCFIIPLSHWNFKRCHSRDSVRPSRGLWDTLRVARKPPQTPAQCPFAPPHVVQQYVQRDLESHHRR